MQQRHIRQNGINIQNLAITEQNSEPKGSLTHRNMPTNHGAADAASNHRKATLREIRQS
jgi:hypothetical protein